MAAVTPKKNVQMEKGKGKGKSDGVGKVSGVGDSTSSSSHNIADPPAAETQKKKVLILMSDTGGGHRASADAIKAAFDQKFPDQYEVSFSNSVVTPQQFRKTRNRQIFQKKFLSSFCCTYLS